MRTEQITEAFEIAEEFFSVLAEPHSIQWTANKVVRQGRRIEFVAKGRGGESLLTCAVTVKWSEHS